MSKERDPLGKRALFSGAENGTGGDGSTGAEGPAKSQVRPPAPPRRGALDFSVVCGRCDATTPLTPQEMVFHHLPVVAWLPWRKRSLFMRCPACNRLAWHTVSRPG
jgi:hypothetical protein